MSDDEQSFSVDSFRADSGASASYRGEVYQGDGDDESADEIDPKKLVRQPTTNDIRWYYRNGALAPTIVDKPVNDAFKHGFSVSGSADKQEFVERIINPFKRAHRKARRDGFALIWFRLRDTADEWEPPANVQGMYEAKVLTLDDLTTAKPLAFEEKLSAGNRDDVLESVTSQTITETETLREAINLGDVDAQDVRGDANRLPRDSDNPQRLATDIDIGAGSGGGTNSEVRTLRYGRSRFYETTDDGIVLSRRLDSDRYEEPIGYLYDREEDFQTLLIHPSRVMHVTWRGDVDGDVEQETWGQWEGDSVLRPIIHLLRAIHKGNWAVAQKLFRHSSPLHVMHYEDGVDNEKLQKAERTIENINAKSSISEPPGFELRTVEGSSEAEIDSSFDVLFDQICAGSEFTRSVLFGTQAGTVSGSDTDVKNYFNKVEVLRTTRFIDELREIVDWYAGLDADDYAFEPGLDIDWGPLFKLSALDRAEAMARHVQLTTQAASNFIVTPDEARSILTEEWADWLDVDIDDGAPMDAADLAALDGNGGRDGNGDEMDGNPAVGQNGGGREEGDFGGSDEPNSA